MNVGFGCSSDRADPVVPEVDTSEPDPCELIRCDDGDPCTDDFCQQPGECIFVPRNAHQACEDNVHCSRPTPCHINTCEVDECGLKRCRLSIEDGCRACDNGAAWVCAQSSPCRPGRCDEAAGICRFDEALDGCDAWCSTSRSVSLFNLRWVEPEQEVAVAGTVSPATLACDACKCEVPMVLRSGLDSLRLEAAPGDEPLTCRISACSDPGIECLPFIVGRDYFVRGVVRARAAADAKEQAPQFDVEADADAPGANIDRLEVESFCPSLHPTDTAVLGPLAGRLDGGGDVATFELVGFSSGTMVRFVDCVGCDRFGVLPISSLITLLDGELRLDLNMTTGTGLARLIGQGNRFIGELLDPTGAFVAVITLDLVPMDPPPLP
jgi:hypothetical protein